MYDLTLGAKCGGMFVNELDSDAEDLKLFFDRHTHQGLNC